MVFIAITQESMQLQGNIQFYVYLIYVIYPVFLY